MVVVVVVVLTLRPFFLPKINQQYTAVVSVLILILERYKLCGHRRKRRKAKTKRKTRIYQGARRQNLLLT